MANTMKHQNVLERIKLKFELWHILVTDHLWTSHYIEQVENKTSFSTASTLRHENSYTFYFLIYIIVTRMLSVINIAQWVFVGFFCACFCTML